MSHFTIWHHMVKLGFSDLASFFFVPRFKLGKDLGVSKNSGTPKSSILRGFSIINHPFWGTPIFGKTHLFTCFSCWTWRESPRHNLPAALILEDDFDLQPDFALGFSTLGRNRFFPEPLNLTIGADDEFFLLHNRSVEVK